MFVILWEFRVKPGYLAEFIEKYGPNGSWAQLFSRSQGFLKTELLRSESQPDRFLTLDQWASMQDYEAFHSQWYSEYASLDAQCDGLTESEVLLGRWETVRFPADQV